MFMHGICACTLDKARNGNVLYLLTRRHESCDAKTYVIRMVTNTNKTKS